MTVPSAQEKTASEVLFEKYLREHGWPEPHYEPPQPNTAKRVDYEMPLDGAPAFFEVKEFEQQQPPTSGSYDPYAPIRKKINDAQKQLVPHKGKACSVVIANPNGAFVELDDMGILGAMLGNVGFEIPFNKETGTLDSKEVKQAFLGGGKMIRYAKAPEDRPGLAVPMAPQNTTISAVVALTQLPLGNRRFRVDIARRERDSGQRLSIEAFWDLATGAEGTELDVGLKQLRVQIYENPYALTPLSPSFGSGAWDERIGHRDGRLTRLFAGSALLDLERAERGVGIEPDDGFGLRR